MGSEFVESLWIRVIPPAFAPVPIAVTIPLGFELATVDADAGLDDVELDAARFDDSPLEVDTELVWAILDVELDSVLEVDGAANLTA